MNIRGYEDFSTPKDTIAKIVSVGDCGYYASIDTLRLACLLLPITRFSMKRKFTRRELITRSAAIAGGLILTQEAMQGAEAKSPHADAPKKDAIGFGGVPPLGPDDRLRHLLKPYDLVKLNVLGINYCENLLDMRLNVTSYTHLGYNSPSSDAWHLQFPDDAARFLEGLAWEDEYSPVVRLETARRIVKGLLAAKIPGAVTESYFRHRSGGKTFLIFDDPASKDGRVLLSMWGDSVTGSVQVGFRVSQDGEWREMSAFHFTPAPNDPLDAHMARDADGGRYWNESPMVLHRKYEANDASAMVEFIGRYWLSDENKPLEFGYTVKGAEKMQVVVGEPGAPIPVLGDDHIPTTVHLPDRKTTYRSDRDGDVTLPEPNYNYLILTKPGAWGATGYSTALLVMWDGKPEKVEVIADKGYGEVRVIYAGASGKVWINPYNWLDDRDMDILFRSAEGFLTHGEMPQNGFPTQQLLNAIPSGLAAGAYLLTKYRDPMAHTARINSIRAVDRLFEAEDEGKTLVRVFFTVKAAAWMVKCAKELKDKTMAAHYTVFVERAMRRMCSEKYGYDGTGWAGGWDHFNSMKACRLAYDATGNKDYLRIFDRAMTVYTIDADGIYRYGKKMDAPGGFDTYSGSLPLAVWGNAGRMDWVKLLINLDVPNGWNDPSLPVKDTWNDAGAGPWAQDDANPEFVGYSLRGAKIPRAKKYILPTGSFPDYHDSGRVEITRKPMVINPFFLPGEGNPRVIDANNIPPAIPVERIVVTPGTESERRYAMRLSGETLGKRRTCLGGDIPLVYRFETLGATGLGVDLRIKGDGFQLQVSPDGERWFTRLDTWDPDFAEESTDISFLSGSEEELAVLENIAPPDDTAYLVNPGDSSLERGHCRYVSPGNSIVYSLHAPGAELCRLEMMMGNGYRVDLSRDGGNWHAGVASADPGSPSEKAGADSAVIRMLDATPWLNRGALYVRLSDTDDSSRFAGKPAFLRRMTMYGVYRTGKVWVRLRNTTPENSFTLERLTLRRWR
jgi:hypothetical protein